MIKLMQADSVGYRSDKRSPLERYYGYYFAGRQGTHSCELDRSGFSGFQCVWECRCCTVLRFVVLSAVQARAAVQSSRPAAVCSGLRGRASQKGHGTWDPCLVPGGEGDIYFCDMLVFSQMSSRFSFNEKFLIKNNIFCQNML